MLIVKDFDIELSKKEGYQIRTKERNFVRILDYNRLDDLYPIVALRMDVDKNNNPTEIVTCYTKDGKFIVISQSRLGVRDEKSRSET